MLAWSNLSIPNLFFCILLLCKFLMYFIVFISDVFHCFYDLFFLVIWSWLIQDIRNCANGQKDRINTVLVHFKKISNFHTCMCFVHKPRCKMQILGKFCADLRVQNVTWPPDRRSDFRKLGIKRCARLERKKSWKGVSWTVAVARQSRILCRGGGGGQIDPPPPVKIGLKRRLC